MGAWGLRSLAAIDQLTGAGLQNCSVAALQGCRAAAGPAAALDLGFIGSAQIACARGVLAVCHWARALRELLPQFLWDPGAAVGVDMQGAAGRGGTRRGVAGSGGARGRVGGARG